MLENVTSAGSIGDAMSKASKRSEKPSTSRPTTDRGLPGTSSDAGKKRDRRRPCGTNPNSRQSGGATCGAFASAPSRGKDAPMTPPAVQIRVGIEVSKAQLD